MNKQLTHNQATFNPQAYKTFDGALDAFLEQECPQIGGFRTRQVLVNTIAGMVREFFPETSHLRPGQTPWVTVHRDEKPSYGKSMRKTRLTDVVLDLVLCDEARRRANGCRLRDLKIDAVARLFTQAYEQDGCMTNAEVAILTKMSPSTVGRYVGEWECNNHAVLPRRGTIHDMGPTLTHKKVIIHQLFIEQKTVQEVSRATYHSIDSIQNYITTFRQVLLCVQKGFTTEQTAYAIRRTPGLVREYQNIIEFYDQERHILDQMLHYEPEVANRTPTY